MRAALAQQQAHTRFRIDALVAHTLEPLTALLSNKPYIFSGSGPTSADCLAYGYLALLLYPPVPHAPIAATISKSHPTVIDYANRLRAKFSQSTPLDVPTILRSPLLDTPLPTAPPAPATRAHLPWRTTPPPSLQPTLSNLLTSLTNHLLSPHHRHLLSPSPTTTDRPLLLPFLTALSAPISAALAWFLYTAFYPVPPSEADMEKVFARDRDRDWDGRDVGRGQGFAGWGDAGRVFGEAFASGRGSGWGDCSMRG